MDSILIRTAKNSAPRNMPAAPFPATDGSRTRHPFSFFKYVSAILRDVSPNLRDVSPNLRGVSPNLRGVSQNLRDVSQNLRGVSANLLRAPPGQATGMEKFFRANDRRRLDVFFLLIKSKLLCQQKIIYQRRMPYY
ncbi:MAG: hypothetical protein LBL07_12125 [Tannerella sp.]|nr:hypothetical protein [Tannerella sp.]